MFANLKLIALIDRLIIKLLFDSVTRAAGESREEEAALQLLFISDGRFSIKH